MNISKDSSKMQWVLIALATVVMVCGNAYGQSGRMESQSFLNQQQQIEEGIRRELDRTRPITQDIEFDYGGFYTFDLLIFDDGIESSRTLRRHDLRIWSRLTLGRGAHEFYVRGKLVGEDFNSGDSFDGDDNDIEGMNLDRGFYQFDLKRAYSYYANQSLDYNLRFKIGRDYAQFGTGYVLSKPLDYIELEAELEDWRLRGLVGRTIGSSLDIDVTRPIERTRRSLLGFEATYTAYDKHRPFFYVLWQRDHNFDNFRPSDIFRDYGYDSFYVGLGSVGELWTPQLRYSTEWVYETGKSHGAGPFNDSDNISAWAFDAELEYAFHNVHEPRVSLEYMFASGDGDRRFSPSDTLGGNSKGKDTGFNALGFRDTGLSLAPTLSNLHIWRAGASMFPFKDPKWNKKVRIGTDWFLYWKHHRDGAISDPLASRRSGYAGWEMDYYLDWRVTTDLSFTTRVGAFFPGDAFEDRGTRTFFLTGFTYSF